MESSSNSSFPKPKFSWLRLRKPSLVKKPRSTLEENEQTEPNSEQQGSSGQYVVNEIETKKETTTAIVQIGLPISDSHSVVPSKSQPIVLKTIRKASLPNQELEILQLLKSYHTEKPDKFKYVIILDSFYLNEEGEQVLVFPVLKPMPELKYMSQVDLIKVARVVKMLFSALESIHEHSICHFDVNPANILMNESGELVLIDFGLARICDGSSHPPGRGTPGYIAPELYPPQNQYTTSTTPDIYSAGVLFGQFLDPYIPHCNLRILGGSACYPSHVETMVYERVREFVEFDSVYYDDIIPPIIQLAGDLLLRLLSPLSSNTYKRLTATQALHHPFLAVLDDPTLKDESFTKDVEFRRWRDLNVKDTIRERKRRRGLDVDVMRLRVK